MKYILFSVTGLLLLITSNVHSAAGGNSPYTDLSIMYNQIKVNNGKFKLWTTRIKLGYNFTENWSVEGHYGIGLNDDTDNNVEAKIKQQMGAYVRWGSNVHDNIRLYIMLGQGRTQVEYKGPTQSNKDTLDDFSWAVGAEERSRKVPSMLYTAEYVSYYHKSGQEIWGIALGLKFDF